LGRPTVRVLVVEDYAPWVHFILSLLQKQSELQVIGDVSDGLEGIRKAEELQPDLILLDIGLPTLNGIEVAKRIRERNLKSKILVVSENRSLDVAEEALRVGADGYIIKSDAASDLMPAVEAVLRGKPFVSLSLRPPIQVPSNVADSEMGQTDHNPYALFRRSALISEFLAATVDATAADSGDIQLFDSATRTLRIVAHLGCEREFLGYFDTVSCEHGCACSAAMNERSRIVVMDVDTDPLFSNESRAVMLRAQIRSVQSTPLIHPSGMFVGMVSTLYRNSTGPSPQMWCRLDDLARGFLTAINAEASQWQISSRRQ